MTVLAAATYRTNADLMAAVRSLGYITDDSYGVDVTYGKGVWWKGWSPERLMTHDIIIDAVDFRQLPYPDNLFDFVAFDPPYVPVGGRASSTIPAFNSAYGLTTVPSTVEKLHKLIVEGLKEAHRVLLPKGLVLFKTMNYTTSGSFTPQAYDTFAAVRELFDMRDELIYLRKPGPQPKVNLDGSPRRQLHARQNSSRLLVLEAKK